MFDAHELARAVQQDLSAVYDVSRTADVWRFERDGREAYLLLTDEQLLDYAEQIRESAIDAMGLNAFASAVSLISVHIYETVAMLPDDKDTVVLHRGRFMARRADEDTV